MKTIGSNQTLVAVVATLALAIAASPSRAASYTWDGGTGADGVWRNGGNWVGNTQPVWGTNCDIVFNTAGATNLATVLGYASSGGITLRSLTFNTNANSDVTILMEAIDGTTGKNFTFQSDTGTSTITVDSGAAGNFTINTSTSAGRLNLSNPLVIDHNGSGVLTIRRISDKLGVNNYSVTKRGSGTLAYGNTGTYWYTGETIIEEGVFQYAANDALYTGAVSIVSGTLDVANFSDSVGPLKVTGAATINMGATAALAFDDSSAIAWTGGSLDITGTFVSGSSLRFGTNTTGLTSTQLGQISTNGVAGSFVLDANGYLTADEGGGGSGNPEILSVQTVGSALRLVIGGVAGYEASHRPVGRGNLVFDPWAYVAHGTNSAGAFVVTNLSYSAVEDATNRVIYVQATNSAAFFGIE